VNNLVACVIFWNDGPELLERCMSALRDNDLPIIAIDGAFREVMSIARIGESESTDGCLDVAAKYADSLVLAPKNGWADEVEKRNRCLDHLQVGTYFTISDADEVLRPIILDAPLSGPAYRMIEVCHMPDGKLKEHPYVRIWRREQDLVYKYQHCRLYRASQMDPLDINKGLVSRSSSSINLKFPVLENADKSECKFDHYPHARSVERIAIKEQFYKLRNENAWPY
jgi:hypothetical protein